MNNGLHIAEFMITPSYRKQMEEEWGKNVPSEGAVRECLPRACIDTVMDTAHGGSSTPVLVSNLPEAAFSTHAPKIMHALFKQAELRPTFSSVLSRDALGFHSRKVPDAGETHTDKFAVSALACPINIEEAPTRLTDLCGIAKEMGAGLAAQIGCIQYRDPPATHQVISLQKLIGEGQQPGVSISIEEDKCSPEALEVYQRLLKQYSTDIILKPGQFLLFSNNRGGVFHEAMRGTARRDTIPFKPNVTTRILLYEGAERTGSSLGL